MSGDEKGSGNIFYAAYALFDRSFELLESQRIANLIIIITIIIASLPLLAIGFLVTRPFAPVSASAGLLQAAIASGPSAALTCDGGKYITAIFENGGVQLSLSDGRQISIAEVPGSSVQYANPDGSFVFRERGEAMLLEENGSITYSNCIERG